MPSILLCIHVYIFSGVSTHPTLLQIANPTPDPIAPSPPPSHPPSTSASQEATPTSHPDSTASLLEHSTLPAGANEQKIRGSVHVSIPTAKVSQSDSSYSSSMATTSAVSPSTLESSSTSVRSSISISTVREDDDDRSKYTQTSKTRATASDPCSSIFVQERSERRGMRGEKEREKVARHSAVEGQVLCTTDSSSPATQSVISTPPPPRHQGPGELSVSDLTPSEVQFNPEEETPTCTTAALPTTVALPLQRT